LTCDWQALRVREFEFRVPEGEINEAAARALRLW
jgi:hypothetical protein